jgi:hypothetical protein
MVIWFWGTMFLSVGNTLIGYKSNPSKVSCTSVPNLLYKAQLFWVQWRNGKASTKNSKCNLTHFPWSDFGWFFFWSCLWPNERLKTKKLLLQFVQGRALFFVYWPDYRSKWLNNCSKMANITWAWLILRSQNYFQCLKPQCIQSSRVLVHAGTSKSTSRRHGIQAVIRQGHGIRCWCSDAVTLSSTMRLWTSFECTESWMCTRS